MCICLCTAGKTASASLRRRESRNWVYRLLQALQNVLCAKQAGKDGGECNIEIPAKSGINTATNCFVSISSKVQQNKMRGTPENSVLFLFIDVQQ